MNPIVLDELWRILNARPAAPLLSGLAISGVCTDSRQMVPGSLFIAIRGDQTDGHKYLAAAAKGGAAAALVEEIPAGAPADLPCLLVDNTRRAMGRLARHVRRQMRGKVIGVAGSNGKTSTKHLIHSALRDHLRGTMSPKSYNNDIGVPLSIFPAGAGDDYLVLELGTNHPGEILPLTRMSEPDIGVITNCGPEHLEFLGDLSGVRRENAMLIDGIDPRRGTLVVNGDDAELLEAIKRFPRQRTITFGLGNHNDLFAADVRCSIEGVRFLLNAGQEVHLPLLGKHTAVNSLAAIAVARSMGLSDEQIIQNLADATGPEMRLQMQRINGVAILNDAYNANPASMKAALQTLADLECRRRIAVIGDMRELGESSGRYHEEIGVAAADARLDVLVCVGELSRITAAAAWDCGVGQTMHFVDAASAAREIPPMLREGDLVLLKASRAMKLETIASAIMEARCSTG